MISLDNAQNIELVARPTYELMDMQKKLMLFLKDNKFHFVDEEGFILVQGKHIQGNNDKLFTFLDENDYQYVLKEGDFKVQISPLKLQEKAGVKK